MSPGDYPRLIAIVFSNENWLKVCESELGGDDRLDWKGDILLDRNRIFAKIAKDFINPDWTNDGVPPRNPKDHANATEVDEHANSELDRLREALASLDEEAYRKPALR